MRKALPETTIEAVKNSSENGLDMLVRVYKEFYGINLENTKKKVDPTIFRISLKLVTELIGHAASKFNEDAVELNFVWANYAPTYSEELPRNVIEIK